MLGTLKAHEYRTRYRARRELAGHLMVAVLPAVKRWVAALVRNDAAYERHVLEGLWATWRQNAIDHDLLKQCLAAKSHQVRAAAVEVLRNDFRKIPDATALLLAAANDADGYEGGSELSVRPRKRRSVEQAGFPEMVGRGGLAAP